MLFRATRSVWSRTCLLASAGFTLPGSQRADPEFVYFQVVLGSQLRGSIPALSICSHGLHRERVYSTLRKIHICMKFSVLRDFIGDNAQGAFESRKTCFPHETTGNGSQSRERILPGRDQIFSHSKYLYPYSCQVPE